MGVLFFSLSCNVFLFQERHGNTIFHRKEITKEEFISQCLDESLSDSSYCLKVAMGGVKMPSSSFIAKNDGIVNDWYNCYNWVGLSYWCLYHEDTFLRRYLSYLAKSFIDRRKKDISYEIKSVSQFPIGVFFINLYKITGEELYKDVSEKLYNRLILYCKEHNRIDYFWLDEEHCYVDVLGMIVPFLIEYYNLTGDKSAYNVAISNILIYKEWGTDCKTGIPCHENDPRTGIKKGYVNWGRGIGWYLLALSYCPEIKDEKLLESINKMDYRQYPLSDSQYDTSVALLFEIFKQSRVKGRKPNIDNIKRHTTKEGFIGGSSGDTALATQTCIAPFCNGFLLMLMTYFNK